MARKKPSVTNSWQNMKRVQNIFKITSTHLVSSITLSVTLKEGRKTHSDTHLLEYFKQYNDNLQDCRQWTIFKETYNIARLQRVSLEI